MAERGSLTPQPATLAAWLLSMETGSAASAACVAALLADQAPATVESALMQLVLHDSELGVDLCLRNPCASSTLSAAFDGAVEIAQKRNRLVALLLSRGERAVRPARPETPAVRPLRACRTLLTLRRLIDQWGTLLPPLARALVPSWGASAQGGGRSAPGVMAPRSSCTASRQTA